MIDKKKIYQDLLNRIITNELQPGLQLYEKELMEHYGVGRTPLREIMQDLQRDGLLEIIPKLGTRVVSMDLRNLRETVQLRRELEGLAAKLAARGISDSGIAQVGELLAQAEGIDDQDAGALEKLSNVDMSLHRIIYAAADNAQLKALLEKLCYKMYMYWFQVGFSVKDYREQFDELKELHGALARRDGDECRAIMKRHIDHFTRLIRKNIF